MPHAQKMFSIALLIIAGLVGGSLPARADDDRCEKKIHKAEEKHREAAQRYGENSPQAHKRHEQLEEVRRRCGRDHDHDRDHDRDHDHEQH